MAHLKISKSWLLLATLLYLASSCQAQDAVQIVAKAALCFDNQTVIQGCLKAMGINGNTSRPNNSSAAFLCSPPCFKEFMLIAGCVDGILSNFAFYKPGLLAGVRAIFEMSCSAINSTTNTTGGAASAPAATRSPSAVSISTGAGRELGLPVWMLPWMILAALILF